MKILNIKFIQGVTFFLCIIYPFIQLSAQQKLEYKKLTIAGKERVRTSLIEKLKKDSIYLIYTELSKIKKEAQLGVDYSVKRTHKSSFGQSQKTLKGLTDYYRESGIEKPENYARLDMFRRILLFSLLKKYPEFKEMDLESRITVLKGSRKPITSQELLRQKNIYQQMVNKRLTIK